MSDLVSIGASAIDVYRRALATTGNNIANMNTDGYSRQEVSIGQAVTREVGGITFGTGAQLLGVKRLFDAFAEVSLRSSISNLNTQTPLTDYANRMLDVLGDQVAGLSPSMDQFFAGALELSQDPASRILRDRFMRGAEDLSSRFAEISTQIDTLELETRGAIVRDTDTLTVLASQLANINTDLNRKLSLDKQAPELLDRRDKTLREISAVARISVTEAPNGMVSVSLTDNSQGLIVDGLRAYEVGAVFDDNNPGKVDIVVDPRGNNRAVISGVRSGSLGGLMSFREQVLQPSLDSIDFLALAMVREINAVHTNGVDFNGNAGKNLFEIDPVFTVVSPTQRINVRVDVEVVDPVALRFRDIELTYDDSRKLWIAHDMVSGQRAVSDPVVGSLARININGLEVRISGNPGDAENFVIKAENRPARGIRIGIDDPYEVAAAELFRVVKGDENLGSANALIAYDPLAKATGRAIAIDEVLSNNRLASQSVEPRLIGANADLRTALVGVVPAGFSDVDFFLKSGLGDADDMQLQIFTRDGRHLLGGGTVESLLGNPSSAIELGFEAGATYSDQYLNRSDTNPYKDLQFFYGVRAQPMVTGDFLPIDTNPSATGHLLPAGALVINGKSLGAFDVVAGAEIHAGDVASWINANAIPGVVASAQNVIRILTMQIDTNKELSINGASIDLDGAISPSEQVSRINARTADSGVLARLRLDSTIEIVALDGGNIRFGPGDNALGLNSSRVFSGTLNLTSLDFVDIRLGLDGPVTGDTLAIDSAATLRRLGLDVTPATIASSVVAAVAQPNGQAVIASGAIVVNDVAINKPLSPAATNQLQASDVAAWLNEFTAETGVEARANTSIEIDRSQIDLGRGLTLSIDDSIFTIAEDGEAGDGWNNLSSLIDAINARSADSGVIAGLSLSGYLVLSQSAGKTITVQAGAGGANALGVSGETHFRGSYTLTSDSGPIRVGFGSDGLPRDLSRIGLTANAHIEGGASEDLLVFVTSSSNSSGSIAAEYTSGTIDPIQTLRDNPFDIRFRSDTEYAIVDLRTNTVVAERSFNFGNQQSIQYQGLVVTLSARPKAGDRFRIDGNQDGIGSNANIKRIATLQEDRILAGGLTFADSYQQTVSIVGNQARQAGLAREALQVVNEQAMASRDRVSGVSLDEEAANLVRFQQAFQAAAKVIQTANQIFDTILQIR